MSEPGADYPRAASTGAADTADSADKAVLDRAVDIALRHFARDGFAAAKLDVIAREAGMSKRMLHYHFGDKKELYARALTRAAWMFSPPQDFLERSYAVPVEGIRRFVDILFHRMVQNPDAIQLFLRENLDPVLTEGELTAVRQEAEAILHIERLLLMGQDAGAFRPGVSATDVAVLIAALGFFRTANHSTIADFGDLDLISPANTEGMRRLTIDAVLTFLTSNIPDSGYESYLSTSGSTALPGADTDTSLDYSLEAFPDDIYDTSGIASLDDDPPAAPTD